MEPVRETLNVCRLPRGKRAVLSGVNEHQAVHAQTETSASAEKVNESELALRCIHFSIPRLSSEAVVPSALAMRRMLRMLKFRAPRSTSLM